VSWGSLRIRLLAAGAFAIIIALVATAIGLSLLFERHVERRVLADLSVELDQIAAGIDFDQTGVLRVIRPPADPRLNLPFSGYYWQVIIGDQTLRSRSLWDAQLELFDPVALGVVQDYHIVGPASVDLILAERIVTLPDRLGGLEARIAVAIDRSEIIRATADFGADLLPYLLLVGGLILAAGFMQVTIGLRPLTAVRNRMSAIKAGGTDRLGGGFPHEVQPLANEVDALLDASDAAVKRARARASDLAHALKTPLQILTGDAERLKEKGEAEIADDIGVVADAMRRAIDRELARARIAHGGSPQRSNLAATAARILNVVQRTPDGNRLKWHTYIDASLEVRLDEDSLSEALGNILENASRYASSTVTIEANSVDGSVRIVVADDGGGIAPDQLQDVVKRGVRLDEKGSGLGLAIVADIAMAAGGSIELENRNPGLAVILNLPTAT